MKKRESGIALIAAIFLVVVIGVALVVLATLSVRNSQQTTQNLLQSRSHQATSAAIEATVQRIVLAPTSVGWCNGSSVSIAVPAYTDFTVAVQCQVNNYNRPSQQISLFKLTATAEYGTTDDADYVWSELTATIEL